VFVIAPMIFGWRLPLLAFAVIPVARAGLRVGHSFGAAIQTANCRCECGVCAGLKVETSPAQ